MRPAFRRTASHLVKSGAVAFDRLRPPVDGVVILAYHRVGGETQLELDIESAVFDAQMQYLAAHHSVGHLDQVVPVEGARGSVNGDGVNDTDVIQVVVTFDDGTADFVDNALPVLVANAIPATYYIATEFVEEQRSFPDDGSPMSWAGLAEAVSTGLVTVGSHTHSHAVMDKVGVIEAEEELRRAAGLIEDRLGVEAAHFAYPKGVHGGAEIERVVGRHHRSAALANSATNPAGSMDPLKLGRSPIQRSDSMAHFARKVRGGLRLEGQLRERLNRVRYRSSVN